MPGAGQQQAPRAQPTRVGGPEWNRDPQVSFDPQVAREARRSDAEGGGPGGRGGPGWRDRLPSREQMPWRGRSRPGGRRVSWPKRIGAVLAVVLLATVAFAIYLDSSMNRIEAIADYDDRPSGAGGTNWLIVGSDSRGGLTAAQEDELNTGDAAGNRTDTMMLLHTSAFGQTSLISLPRDSLLPIPGHGRNRLNAAYSIGGPELLTQTVETASGLEIDHYAEIGFEGFSGMVDAVGGVEMCLDEPLDDPLAGVDLPEGCQELDGRNALGFVRSRAFPNADLQRIQNQRKFLSALVSQASSPATVLNPFRMVPLADAGIATLTVDESTHVWHLLRLGWAMRSLSGGSGGVTTTVPVELSSSVSGAVVWDRDKASRLFTALEENDDVPRDLLATPG